MSSEARVIVCGCDCDCRKLLTKTNTMKQDVSDIPPHGDGRGCDVYLLICVECYTGNHKPRTI